MIKTLRISAEIALYIVLLGGVAISIAGAIMTAINNAMYDAIMGTNNQPAGWVLQFVPAVIAGISGVLYFMRRWRSILWLVSIAVALTSAIIPAFYLLQYEMVPFTLFGMIAIAAFAAGNFALWFFKNSNFVTQAFFYESNEDIDALATNN